MSSSACHTAVDEVSKAEAAVARFITQVITECVPVALVVSNATGLAAAMHVQRAKQQVWGAGGFQLVLRCGQSVFNIAIVGMCVEAEEVSQLRVGWLAMRQRCDNMGVVGAAAKQLSLKRPLAAVLQSCALFCSRNRLTLRLSHVAGERNEWADMLSRGADKFNDFWQNGRSCRRSKGASPSGKSY